MSVAGDSPLPAGPKMPAMVQTIGFWSRPTAFLERCRARYGARFTLRLGMPSMPFIVLSDPDEIKDMLLAPPDVLHPGEGGVVLEQFVGRHSIFLHDEEQHLAKRKLLMVPFHGERMQSLAEPITELAEREVASWPREQESPLHPLVHRLVLTIILRVIFGPRADQRLQLLRDHLTEILAFNDSPLSVAPVPSLPPHVQRTFAALRPLGLARFRVHIALADKLIYELIEERRSEGDRDDDLLALLLSAKHDDGTPMDPVEIRDEVMSVLVAGTETTASQLTWTMEHLAREPAVLGRLRAEIDEGREEDYLTATLQEIMRLKPALPQAVPRFVKQPIQIGDQHYPPDVALFASPYLVHHDPNIYPEPYAFRPERFLENPPGTYTWLPFGGGRRRCLGATFAMFEMKIAMRAVIERCELRPTSVRAEATRSRSITITPSRGGRVTLSDRLRTL